jgi:hypothetical protein
MVVALYYEIFSSHPLCFFYTLNFPFFPWINISKGVFRIFLKFELEIFWKMHSKVFIQGQNWINGGIKETPGVGRENSFIISSNSH